MAQQLTPRQRAERVQTWLLKRPESAFDEDLVIQIESEIQAAVKAEREKHTRVMKQIEAKTTRIEKKIADLEATARFMAASAKRKQPLARKPKRAKI